MANQLEIEQVLADPAASFWLKGALSSALDRDPVDAANDAEVLAQLLDRNMPRDSEAGLNQLLRLLPLFFGRSISFLSLHVFHFTPGGLP
jgi:hypothetical protein